MRHKITTQGGGMIMFEFSIKYEAFKLAFEYTFDAFLSLNALLTNGIYINSLSRNALNILKYLNGAVVSR